jgi:hypothetical protein
MSQPRVIQRTILHTPPSSLHVDNAQFPGHMLEYVDAKKVVFENCNFNAAVIYRGYFHEAVFKKCTFVGTRFDECNFRQATFDRCQFDYADFNRCILPIPQILVNLPVHSNVRWELIHNIRANQLAMGDVQHETDLVRKDIEAEIAHWKDVRKRPTSYYAKYNNFRDQSIAWLQCRRLWIEKYIWGHGESLTRLFLATFSALLLLSLFNWLPHVKTYNTVSESVNSFLGSAKFISMLFIDLPVQNSDVEKSPIVSILVVIVRYVAIGLAIPTLYKKIAKR